MLATTLLTASVGFEGGAIFEGILSRAAAVLDGEAGVFLDSGGFGFDSDFLVLLFRWIDFDLFFSLCLLDE